MFALQTFFFFKNSETNIVKLDNWWKNEFTIADIFRCMQFVVNVCVYRIDTNIVQLGASTTFR